MFLIVSQAGSWALHRGNFHGENRLLNTKVRWLPKVLQLPHQFADNALRCILTLYLFLFLRSKQSLFSFSSVINELEIKWNVKYITAIYLQYIVSIYKHKNLWNLFTKPDWNLYLSETNLSYLQRSSSSHELVRWLVTFSHILNSSETFDFFFQTGKERLIAHTRGINECWILFRFLLRTFDS